MFHALQLFIPILPQTTLRSFHSSYKLLFFVASKMAKSKYDYVRQFEADDRCLPNSWMVIRIDGNNFHTFSQQHSFSKPNDLRALGLMNASARAVLHEYKAVFIAYGQSDEYSFVFRKDATNFSRRASKLISNVVSLFTSNYVFQWADFFPDQKLLYPPAFDSRVILYPTEQNLRDYLAWRQVDCHINNLFNTCFWALVLKGGMTNVEAETRLKGTVSKDKNEILFSQFDINYNNLPQVYRKGTVLLKTKIESVEPEEEEEKETLSEGKSRDAETETKTKKKKQTKRQQEKNAQHRTEERNCDLIQDEFWSTSCLLSEFGCHDKPMSARNIAIDKMEDFSKW